MAELQLFVPIDLQNLTIRKILLHVTFCELSLLSFRIKIWYCLTTATSYRLCLF